MSEDTTDRDYIDLLGRRGFISRGTCKAQPHEQLAVFSDIMEEHGPAGRALAERLLAEMSPDCGPGPMVEAISSALGRPWHFLAAWLTPGYLNVSEREVPWVAPDTGVAKMQLYPRDLYGAALEAFRQIDKLRHSQRREINRTVRARGRVVAFRPEFGSKATLQDVWVRALREHAVVVITSPQNHLKQMEVVPEAPLVEQLNWLITTPLEIQASAPVNVTLRLREFP